MAGETDEPGSLRQVTLQAAGLRDGSDALTSWQNDSEAAFLGLGNSLVRAHARLRQTLDAMAALSEAVLDRSGDEAITTLRSMAELSGALVSDGGERRACLEALRADTHGADGMVAGINRTLRLLHHLAVLARIDAETGRNAGFAELRAFVSDVASLLERGQETASAMALEIETLATTLQQAWTLENSVGDQNRERITELSSQLQHLAGGLDQHRGETQAAAAEIAHQFDGIWRAVGDVVQRIQFQDAARQRLEHTTAGIERLLLVAERGRLSDAGEPLVPTSRPTRSPPSPGWKPPSCARWRPISSARPQRSALASAP